jgi:predicted MFS family arabinose efflux permease
MTELPNRHSSPVQRPASMLPAVSRRDRTARISASAAFAVQGLCFVAVIAQVTVFQDRYAMDEAQLTVTLAAVPIIAGVGSVVAGILAPRVGSGRVLRFVTVGEALLAATLGLVDDEVAFYAAVGLFALIVGAVDATMNMQGTAVQRRYGRSILASCHAWWSVAAIAGAASAVWASDHAVPLGDYLGVVGATGAVIALVSAPWLLSKAEEAEEPAAEAAAGVAQVHQARHRGLVVTGVGLALMVMFVGDSAATSYGTVFMKEALDSTGGRIQAGLFAYLVLQLLGRVVADRVIGAMGAARSLVLGALVAVAGFVTVAVAGVWSLALTGFALAGLGLSVMVPLTFSAADGLDPTGSGTVIAKVNLFNYAGVIVGSAIIGIVAGPGYENLRLAFGVPAALVLLSAALAPVFRVVDRARAAARLAMTQEATVVQTSPTA